MPKLSTSENIDNIQFVEQGSTPATPATGFDRLYFKDDGKLYRLDDASNEVEVGGSGGSDTDAIHDNAAGEIAALTEKTTPVSADLLIIEDSEASNAKNKVQIGNLPIGGGTDFIYIIDQKTSGTNGGTFTSGAWRTRDLNTELADAGGHASLSSNQITLAAGTYRCYISAPAQSVFNHKAKLYNISDSADELIGTSEYQDVGTTRSIIAGRFTIASSKVFEVQHRCTTTSPAGVGFGVQSGYSVVEVYTVAMFWKEA